MDGDGRWEMSLDFLQETQFLTHQYKAKNKFSKNHQLELSSFSLDQVTN